MQVKVISLGGVSFLGITPDVIIQKATNEGQHLIKGVREGYALITYSDNSTKVFEWNIKFSISETTHLKIFSGIGKYIKGTGRFEGIQGEVILTGQETKPITGEVMGGAYFDVTATYSLSSQ